MKHIPVLLNQSIQSLNIKKNGIYIDCTFGSGGHSSLILSKLGKLGTLYAIDKDYNAVLKGIKTIKDKRFKIYHCNFSRINEIILQRFNLMGKINGIILDCGISSLQLDNPDRGFSFDKEGYLDMRMDQSYGQSAGDWISKASEKQISFVLKNYGNEFFAKKISRAICKKRIIKPIKTTKDLANIICTVMSRKKKFRHHPATKSFLAIRTYINNELEELKSLLNISLNALSPLGRLSIITFNSLEDKIVKSFMLRYSNQNVLPRKLPINEKQIKKLNLKKFILFKKILPDKKEILKNIRSRSSILRSVERNIL